MSIDSVLKDYILGYKTTEEIIEDFQALFTSYASYSDALLTTWIDFTYYIVPAYVIEIGFETTYKMFLYSMAHLLVSQDVQADGSTSSADDRLSKSMSVDGVSISYGELGSKGTLSEWEYFFGGTSYGKMVLLLMKNNAFGSSGGASIV